MVNLDLVLHPFLAGLVASGAVAIVIRLTWHWHRRFSSDNTRGPQRFHDLPVPRIGGVSVLAGAGVAALVASPPLQAMLLLVLVSGAAAWLIGTVEDCSARITPVLRLIGTLLSGLVFCLWGEYLVRSVGIPPLDELLTVAPAAILFTAFALGGIAHGTNLIDGFHGLAGGAVVIMLAALALVAHRAGDGVMIAFCVILIGVTIGFLLVNFPRGLVFLGDGGAYLAGFMLGATAVMIFARNPEISPWAAIVALAYPVTETGVSVVRKLRRGRSPMQPDRLHLHMVIYAQFGRKIARIAPGTWNANAATGTLMWSGPLLCLIGLATLPLEDGWMMFAYGLFVAMYLVVYRKVVRNIGTPLAGQEGTSDSPIAAAADTRSGTARPLPENSPARGLTA